MAAPNLINKPQQPALQRWDLNSDDPVLVSQGPRSIYESTVPDSAMQPLAILSKKARISRRQRFEGCGLIDHGHHTSVGKGTLGMLPMLYLHDRAGPLRAMPLPLWQLSALAGLGIGPRHAGRWSNFVSGSAGTLGLSDASSTHVHHPSRDSVGSTKPSLLDRFTAIFKRRSF